MPDEQQPAPSPQPPAFDSPEDVAHAAGLDLGEVASRGPTAADLEAIRRVAPGMPRRVAWEYLHHHTARSRMAPPTPQPIADRKERLVLINRAARGDAKAAARLRAHPTTSQQPTAASTVKIAPPREGITPVAIGNRAEYQQTLAAAARGDAAAQTRLIAHRRAGGKAFI